MSQFNPVHTFTSFVFASLVVVIALLLSFHHWVGKVKEDEMGEVCSRQVEIRNAYRILVGKREWKRVIGRPRRGWEDIRMNLGQIELEVVDWIHLAQDRDQWRALVNTVTSLRFP
jgi:hypothetical protein